MQILNNWHKISDIASECEMQEQIDTFLREQSFKKMDQITGRFFEVPKITIREFRVPEVGRISDHVLLIDGKRAVNIECKLDDVEKVIQQAEDHLLWCDYSIICMPPDGKYIPTKYIAEIIQKGIGLWYWFRDIGVHEFINPRFNRKKDKDLRLKIITRIKVDEIL